jgi:hypothetical protein
MRTPSGVECAYYYEDMHRGRNRQECRVARSERSAPWSAADCAKCPVPGILIANGSPFLELTLTVRRGLFGRFGGRMRVAASCGKHNVPIEDPYYGCPQCAQEMLAAVDLPDIGDGSGSDEPPEADGRSPEVGDV